MQHTTGTGMRSMRSSMRRTGVMPSITCASVASGSNSRTSAPTMKPFSLPEVITRPRMERSRAPCSTRSTMAISSSSGRRPSEFWLSPSRSNTAQAIPCRSIENRQSRNAFTSGHDTRLICRGAVHRPRVMPRRHVVRPHLGRIEMVDGNDARRERFELAQHARLVIGDDAGLGRRRRSSRCRARDARCRRASRGRASSRPPRPRPPWRTSPRAGRSDRWGPARRR